jgi:hypothetical protein
MKKLLASLALAIAAFGMVGGTASAAPLATTSASPTHTAGQVAARLGLRGCLPWSSAGVAWPMPLDYVQGKPHNIRPQVALTCIMTTGPLVPEYPGGPSGSGDPQSVDIDQYANHAQVMSTLGLARSLGYCRVSFGAGHDFVLAGNVIVEVDSTPASEHVKTVIGTGATLLVGC